MYTYIVYSDWIELLNANKDRLEDIISTVEQDQSSVPALRDVFKPFQLLPLNNVSVVIIGQNPYNAKPGMANGLAFSLDLGTSATIDAMFSEIRRSYNTIPQSSLLLGWVNQGVLLLNSVLTINLKGSKSTIDHEVAWYFFMRHLVYYISKARPTCVFMLWGTKAHELSKYIRAPSELIIESPFPLNTEKFLGCNAFVKCNVVLEKYNCTTIDWTK